MIAATLDAHDGAPAADADAVIAADAAARRVATDLLDRFPTPPEPWRERDPSPHPTPGRGPLRSRATRRLVAASRSPLEGLAESRGFRLVVLLGALGYAAYVDIWLFVLIMAIVVSSSCTSSATTSWPSATG